MLEVLINAGQRIRKGDEVNHLILVCSMLFLIPPLYQTLIGGYEHKMNVRFPMKASVNEVGTSHTHYDYI